MKDICIKEEGKIIIDIYVLQEVSTCILENLKDIDLLFGYIFILMRYMEKVTEIL